MNSKWEYIHVTRKTRVALHTMMEKLGKEGWEAYAIVPDIMRGTSYSYTAFLKRKIENSNEKEN